jgi:hypothetical protein
MTNVEMLSMALPILAVVVALIVVAATLKEGRGDEREVLHRMIASRAAFVLGLAVLSVGTVYQTLTHSLDPWLIGALVAVTLGKIIGLIISRNNH